MVRLNKNGCAFYKVKKTFKEYGEDRVIYCDNKDMSLFRNTNVTDVSILEIVPNSDQIDRLNVLNTLDLSQIENWNTEVTDFVVYGYIAPDANSVLSTIKVDYETTTKQRLLEIHGAKLASIRYNKEVEGVEFNGKIAHTDRSAQSSIASAMLAFSAGVLTETNFKFKSGWETFDTTTFVPLAKTVSQHVSKCFNAEKLVVDELELLDIVTLAEQNEDGDYVVDITTMFETKLSTL